MQRRAAISRVEVKIVVDCKDDVGIENVRHRLAAAGVEVDRVMPAIGTIFGSCEDTEMEQLNGIEGVTRVQPEGTVKLPPFSPDVPQ
jgi:hypothetical protein